MRPLWYKSCEITGFSHDPQFPFQELHGPVSGSVCGYPVPGQILYNSFVLSLLPSTATSALSCRCIEFVGGESGRW